MKWPAALSTCVWIGGTLLATPLLASKFFHHRARAFNEGGVPAYNYRAEQERESVSVVAIASVDQPTISTRYTRESNGTRQGTFTQRKNFYVALNSIEVRDVRLSRMGFTMYDTGQYACTGTLQFGGGFEESLLGANVVIRVRAYAGVPQHPGTLNNMPLLWETERDFWVPRRAPFTTSLLPNPLNSRCKCQTKGVAANLQDSWPQTPSDLILMHFDEITHLEIELEHRGDR